MDNLLPFLVVGLSVGAVYALSGVGLVVLYRASGVVNFAYGALGGLAAMLCWQVIDLEYADWMGWVAGIGGATLPVSGDQLISPPFCSAARMSASSVSLDW